MNFCKVYAVIKMRNHINDCVLKRKANLLNLILINIYKPRDGLGNTIRGLIGGGIIRQSAPGNAYDPFVLRLL
jgi:hypothetical protein